MQFTEFSMAMELDCKEFYEKLAIATENNGLNNILCLLAADEQKHYNAIAAMNSSNKVTMEDSTVSESANKFFKDLRLNRALVDSSKMHLEGYRLAKEIEMNSLKFYEQAADKENDIEISNIYRKIADEEKTHYAIMEYLYDFLRKTENLSAMSKFNNLH